MAHYLSNINLEGNAIQQFAIETLGMTPTTLLNVGRKYYNSSEGREAIYDGKAWKLSVYKSEFDTLDGSVTDINTRLASIETFFKNEEQSDNAINKWNEIVDFLANVSDTTLNGILEGYTVKTRNISAGTGLTGGGDLSVDRTLSLAEFGTAGTYTKVTVDKYGRVQSGVASIEISEVSGLQDALNDRYTRTETDNLLAKYVLLEKKDQIIKGNIRIEGNLVVTGDSTSGGEGGGSSASGVTGIVVNGDVYYAEAGLVTIPDYPTSLEWNKINGRPTSLSAFTDDVGYVRTYSGSSGGGKHQDLYGDFNFYGTTHFSEVETDSLTLVDDSVITIHTDDGEYSVDLLKLTKKHSATITKGTATSYTINHKLNTKDVVVMVYDPNYNQVMVDVKAADANNVTILFANAPSQNYKVVIVG